ncbi:MAG: DOMON domain-containing protein [Brevinematia bacterium]
MYEKDFLIFVMAIASSLVFANASPKIDGEIKEKEYSKVYDLDKNFKVYVSYDEKNAYFTIDANSKGWVSLGFGSKKMDKAVMYIFYYDNNSKKFLVEQAVGIGHNHKTVDKPNSIVFEGKRLEGKTVVEFQIPRNLPNLKLEGKVDAIWAFSGSDSLKAYHSKRGSFEIDF